MSATRPHHASPWVVDTRTLGRRPGTEQALSLTVDLLAPIGDEVVAVPAGARVEILGRVEAVAEGVLVSATATGTAVGVCSRCLDEVRLPLRVPLRELFAYPGSTTAATTDDDEIPRISDDLLDLEALVRDEVRLALPLVPLCRPDCAGLCPECGLRRDDLEPGHSHEIIDPRWAALTGRFGTDDGDRHSGTGTNTKEK